MFQVGVSEINEDCGLLRSGKIFQSNNKKRIATQRESCSATKRGYYELVPHLNKESCDQEEDYQLIS